MEKTEEMEPVVPTAEELAKEYHDICRVMVSQMQNTMIMKPTRPYIPWADLTEDQKDGRLFIARQLLERFTIHQK